MNIKGEEKEKMREIDRERERWGNQAHQDLLSHLLDLLRFGLNVVFQFIFSALHHLQPLHLVLQSLSSFLHTHRNNYFKLFFFFFTSYIYKYQIYINTLTGHFNRNPCESCTFMQLHFLPFGRRSYPLTIYLILSSQLLMQQQCDASNHGDMGSETQFT